LRTTKKAANITIAWASMAKAINAIKASSTV
jgi:hypothetical protein